MGGLYLYKISVIVLPLLPLLILVVQSTFTMNNLINEEKILTNYERQVMLYLIILIIGPYWSLKFYLPRCIYTLPA